MNEYSNDIAPGRVDIVDARATAAEILKVAQHCAEEGDAPGAIDLLERLAAAKHRVDPAMYLGILITAHTRSAELYCASLKMAPGLLLTSLVISGGAIFDYLQGNARLAQLHEALADDLCDELDRVLAESA